MATVSHASLTADADLHEPKGAFAASAGEVYIADGAGAGSFQNPVTALDLVADANAAINTSFTPVLRENGTDVTSLGATFSATDGRYTRIGGLVLVAISFTLSSKGSISTGELTIDLPHDNILSGPFTVVFSNVTFGAVNAPVAFAQTSTDRILFRVFGTTGHANSIGGGVLSNSSTITVFGVYGLSS